MPPAKDHEKSPKSSAKIDLEKIFEKIGYDETKLYKSEENKLVKDYKKKYMGIDCDDLAHSINTNGLSTLVEKKRIPTLYGEIMTLEQLFDECKFIESSAK
ncbi:MAG: hypothetical protein KC505_02590 [Myxococcales bacterium]|nr:hypothetical protein [Myxococcales bacterium]USN50746.1 MAG: hypothetical protein H6731_10895 [Myxococcales bacterium]